jgi:predicted phosphodiesterase
MKVQIVSDLHLEFYSNNLWKLIKQFKITGDYLFLAGDIGYPVHHTFKEFFEYIHTKYKRIFYIAGNHEYYSKHSISDINTLIEYALLEYPNVQFLNKQYYDFEDDGKEYRVLGCTLWFLPKNDEKELNDYTYIHLDSSVPLTNEWIELEWNNSRKFIQENVATTRTNIVMTHHLPSYEMILPKYETSSINHYFASPCDDLIHFPVKYWICGHSHGFLTKEINGVQCIMNAFGYPAERHKRTIGYSIEI